MLNKFSTRMMFLMALAVLLFVGFTYAGMEYSSTSEFCVSCHTMQEAYQTWTHSAHRSPNTECADCHLPQQIARKVPYKIKSGVWDVYVTMTGPPIHIRAKDDTREIVNANCNRCHSTLVEHIKLDDNRKCVDCHRTTPHGL